MKHLNRYLVHGLFLALLTNNFTSAMANLGNVLNKLAIDNGIKAQETLASNDEAVVRIKALNVLATAYASVPEQTDDTPFTTASNTTVRDGIIAANFLKFGTKVRIPELFGNKILLVEDRMNRRYTEANPPRIDIWMAENDHAITFGLKQVTLEVLE